MPWPEQPAGASFIYMTRTPTTGLWVQRSTALHPLHCWKLFNTFCVQSVNYPFNASFIWLDFCEHFCQQRNVSPIDPTVWWLSINVREDVCADFNTTSMFNCEKLETVSWQTLRINSKVMWETSRKIGIKIIYTIRSRFTFFLAYLVWIFNKVEGEDD